MHTTRTDTLATAVHTTTDLSVSTGIIATQTLVATREHVTVAHKDTAAAVDQATLEITVK